MTFDLQPPIPSALDSIGHLGRRHVSRPWTTGEDELLHSMINGKAFFERQANFPVVARMLGRTESACRYRATLKSLVMFGYKHVPQSKMREAIDLASEETGVSIQAIRGGSRRRHVSKARWIAFAILRHQGYSLPAIGSVFGHHHTSILHGLRRLKEIEGVR